MEMNVDRNLVKTERHRRAWSQEHLAEVSGLSLRTIQRIEKTGIASYESANSLASIFSIDVADLRNQRGLQEPSIGWRTANRGALGATGLALLAAISLFTVTSTFAEPLLLDFDISRKNVTNDDEDRQIGQLVTETGKAAEIRMDGELRFVVVPTIEDDGRVLLAAEVYEFIDGDYVLLAEPKLITADREEAEIRISSDSGSLFRFLIVPHKNQPAD